VKKTWLALPVSALVFLTGCCSIGGKPESETRFSTDRAAFLSATKPTGEITFAAGLTNNARLTDYSTAAGFSLGEMRFTGPSPSCGFALAVIAPHDPFRTNWEGNPMTLCGPCDGAIMIYPPPHTVAIGVEAYTVSGDQPQPYGQSIRITTSTGENQVLPTYEKPQLAFLCVTSAHPIEWIKLETLTGKHNPELATVVYTVRKSRYWPWQW
jgi:hypothetical protein